MKYITHNDTEVVFSGCKQGTISADYYLLKKLFGKHTVWDDFKSDAEWFIKFEDGLTAFIYNYKSGKNYCGRRGTATTKIKSWNIGGEDIRSYDRIIAILDESQKNKRRKK